MTTQTHNPVPVANAAFIETLQAFLRQEDADRFADMFENFVVVGGLHGVGAGLTHTPAPLTAYPAGFLVTETGAITYTNAVTTWVICDPETTGNNGSYVRVAGTHYLTAISGVQPAVPANACPLMGVVTAGGSVISVQDLRLRGPVQRLALNGIIFSGYYATLQEAIDALPPEGGTVFVEPGTYVLTTTLTIGNGSATAISTRRGVALRGTGSGGTALSVLQWAGGAAPVVQIRGPLIGWGIENIFIHGADIATYGIQVVSGQYGHVEDVDLHGCQSAGLALTSVGPTALGDIAISQHNRIANLFIDVAGDCGMDLDALTSATATMFNTFDNILLNVTGNGVGLRLGCTLNNTFTALRVITTGGATGSVHLAYDNTVDSERPAGNVFVNLEPGDIPLTQGGTPGALVPPNLIVGLSPFASTVVPPDVDGVAAIYASAETGALHLLASQNPSNTTQPVGPVVVGQVPGQVRDLVPEIDAVASLGTPDLRWHRIHVVGGVQAGVTAATVAGTLDADDAVVLANAAGGAFTLTLPTAVGIGGKSYTIKKVDATANAVTIDADGTETIDGAATTVLAAQWDAVTLISDGTFWFIVGVGP